VTVALGVMSVPAPVDGDSIRRYETGTLPDGGLWTALRRLSDHDHTGGDLGTPISVASLPDGSITVDKLDPAVLLPYALVDGSKPFTGQVTMQADAVVRDAVYFGQQGTALAPDATLSRTGAGALRVDTHLGVGVTPAAWGATARAVQVGPGGAVAGDTAAPLRVDLSANTFHDGTTRKAVAVGAAGLLRLEGDALSFDNAPSAAAGATQTTTTRLTVGPTGTLTVFPDGEAAAVAVSTAGYLHRSGSSLEVVSNGHVYLNPSTNYVLPRADRAANLGTTGVRWEALYAFNGTIQVSSVAHKESAVPLDPVAALAAVRQVAWYAFAYRPPAYVEPPAQEGQDSDDRQRQLDEGKAAHARMLVETAPARNQRGFIFPDAEGGAKDELGGTLPPVPDLFGLSDRESTTAQADLATVACGLQEHLRQFDALAARVAALEAPQP
jgi:hypothetical protein